ncbi:smoothelin isoform X1 [Pipra filicauda]|uniref:Smoothelin isoform X1 n=1 Tax=Pipra filicauda TaxID=649802 RepID=A0A7R5KD93_9PASS|nr:smoothelin isoform X1 [Pipra filicauda]
MSQESLLGMDEGALRKLLEATLDLAERRRIRSAIRELQRQELERDEEALASKRFRPERGSHRQDDKENWPRSQHLEEEQQAALAALSQELETITSVEELTKLLRAAGEYEERKVIRAAIRKLRAEEIEAATLAGNVQSSRRDGNEPHTVPGDAKSIQRDDAETPALTGSGESLGEGSTKPLGTARRGESSHQDDAELPALDELEESGHRGAAEQPPAQEPKVSALHVGVRCQALGPDGRQGRPRVAPVSTQDLVGTPARLNTHQWEQVSSSLCPAGPTAPRSAGPPPPSAAGSVRERAQRFGPAGAGGAGGRAGTGAGAAQWQRGPRTAPPAPAQNARGSGGAEQRPAPRPAGRRLDAMKTFFTIEIKDGRVQPLAPRITAAPSSQRAEVTLGLRSTPIRITTIPSSVSSICNISSVSSNVTKDPCAHFEGTEEPSGPVAHPPTFSSTRQQSALHLSRTNSSMDPEVVEQPQVLRLEPELPNGMEKVQVREVERRSKLNVEELSRIEDEDVLDKMLDRTTDFEERRLIRNAMRELRQRKRDQREKERDQRLQEARSQAMAGRAGHATETTTTQSTQSADGSARSTVTKTERLVQSSDGTKTSRTTTMESSYVKRSDSGNSTFVQTKSSYSSSSKKTGSVFDREDESASRQSSLAALERRQAEKKKELMKAQSLPKTSTSQARKAMMEKLQKEGGSSPNPAASQTSVQRSSSFGVPNANSIKQMLLDWCRAKTRGYEHVDIQNFSSSWSDGMAFCALVHNFFPDAFDYSKLTPQNRRHNFEVAFSSAEKHADCPQLLDVEDMVRMREPDWKCVYTYIQEFYRCLVQKGLVKTKKS